MFSALCYFMLQVQHVDDKVKDLLLKIQQGQVCVLNMKYEYEYKYFVSEFINYIDKRQFGEELIFFSFLGGEGVVDNILFISE